MSIGAVNGFNSSIENVSSSNSNSDRGASSINSYKSNSPQVNKVNTGTIESEIFDEKKTVIEYTGQVNEKTVIDAIEKANKKLFGVNTELQFSVHEATKRINVKILDKQTGDVIKEFPSEKVLDMIAKMWEVAGLFVDEKR